MSGREVLGDDELEELARLRSALARHRWPWAPLAAVLGGSAAAQARALGVHDAQVHRWRREGLTDRMADRCAILVGVHPSMIWPDWDTVGSPAGDLVDVA